MTTERKAAHTPGPWELYRARQNLWHLNQAKGAGYICDLPYYDHRGPECEANAHLIEAAPELLFALIEAHDALVLAERNTMSGTVGEALRYALDLSEKVIAKARGE